MYPALCMIRRDKRHLHLLHEPLVLKIGEVKGRGRTVKNIGEVKGQGGGASGAIA